NGTVTFLANGSVTYTPNLNFNGTDSFTYTVTSGGVTETAVVTVTVNAVNDAPVATGDSFTTPEDTPFSGTLPAATDVDGDTLTYSLATPAANGTVVVNANGAYTYTPNLNYNGPDSFTFTVSDGNGGFATETVTIDVGPVNNDPVVNGTSITLNEDAAYSGSLPAATDVDGDALTYSLASAPANGVVTVNADGTFTYTPNADFNGADSFTFTVSDGNGGTDTASVLITVNPVNDPPTQVVPGSQTTAEDTNRVITGTSVADVDGGALTTTLTLPAGAGSIAVVTGGGATITGNGTGTVTIAGTAAQINAAIASITYTPTADYNGSTSLSVSTTDGTATASNSIAITVTPVADIVADSVTTNEDTAATFNVITGT
ncbi:MAG: tandem-95 repeat protein, partial [Actinomycetes bacterium]